jgi:hypothetical protein
MYPTGVYEIGPVFHDVGVEGEWGTGLTQMESGCCLDLDVSMEDWLAVRHIGVEE